MLNLGRFGPPGTTAYLPVPPSANHLFITRGRKRVKAPEYRKWLEDAGYMFSRMVSLPPKVSLEVTVAANVNRKRDLDNLLKPAMDSLQKSGVIPDDRWVDRIVAMRASPGTDIENGFMVVTVGEL